MLSLFSKAGEAASLGRHVGNNRLMSAAIAALLIIWLVVRPMIQNGFEPESQGESSDYKSRNPFKLPSRLENWSPFKDTPKVSDDTLVLYAYHETDTAFENARFFVQHGLHASAHFIFILNGESPRLDPIITQALAPNIEVIRRDNTCFDLGAFGHVIEGEGILSSTTYSKFILMNASVRGPFLPTWSKACWSTAWLSEISETTKLQGMTVNCVRGMHVQSMILGTDRAGLQSMYDDGSFTCADSIQSAWAQEVAITSKIQEHDWEVNAWMTALHGDPTYTPENRTHCVDLGNGDHLFNGNYWGFNVHPYETMFVKTNRNIDSRMVEKLTEWHYGMNYSSYDYC